LIIRFLQVLTRN